MKRWIAVAVVGAVALGGAFGLTGTASAAKPDQFTIELDCGADGTLEVAVQGNGLYSPGRIVGGGAVVPVAFLNQHGTFTDNEGHTETFEDPDVSRGGPTNKDFIDCHFEGTFEDENGSGTFEGDVTAFIVGRR